MSSQLQNTHYFIFQHRDLVWSWSITQEKLEQHKHKVLPHSEGDKLLGINKIVNAFNDYDGKDMEMLVYNGCIEHAFAMKGDITQLDARVHWLYISNGEKGKWMELEELEDKNLQLSYLSKSFEDKEIPNIGLISSFRDISNDTLTDDDVSEEDKEDIEFVFRTLLHNDILNVINSTVCGGLKKGNITDKRDVYLYDEIFNLTEFHITRMIKNKRFEKVMNKIGADKLYTKMKETPNRIVEKAIELYGGESVNKHMGYVLFESQDRDMRLKLRGNKKVFTKLQKIVDKPMDYPMDMKTIIQFTCKN